MEQLESSGSVSSFAGEKDRLPKNALGARLRIRSRVVQQFGSHVISPSEEGAVILALDPRTPTAKLVEQAMAMAWDDEEPKRIKQAEALYASKIDKEVEGAMQGVRGASRERIRTVRERFAGMSKIAVHEELRDPTADNNLDRAIYDMRDKMYARSGDNVNGCFHELFGRSIKPFKSVEVLEWDVQPGELREDVRRDSAMTHGLLADMLSSIQQKHEQEIAALKAQIAELVEATTAPKKQK